MINKEPLTMDEMQELLEIADKVVYLNDDDLSLEKTSDKTIDNEEVQE